MLIWLFWHTSSKTRSGSPVSAGVSHVRGDQVSGVHCCFWLTGRMIIDLIPSQPSAQKYIVASVRQKDDTVVLYTRRINVQSDCDYQSIDIVDLQTLL
jgi:hypothetical protein